MMRLLVSVRNADEARLALEAGVDLLDLKEPRRGPLGAVSAGVMREVLELAAGQVPVSAALGELREWNSQFAQTIPIDLALAKIGLAGCAEIADWPRRWQSALAQLPDGVASVAVVYADDRTAAAPRPEEVLHHALRLGCRAVLVDTFDKSGQGLCEYWTPKEIERFVSEVQDAGLWAVVAGSIRLAQLPQIFAAGPDWVAVRGAVCRPARDGSLDATLVRAFRADVDGCQMFSSSTRRAHAKAAREIS
jgi:uncharacterized protein (UPF0264 family)